MINSVEFAKRLEEVMDYYELSAASFADQVEVGRSSISHLLSGRNKPSLDFVLKILAHFPEVELYWLLNGKGDFPKSKPTTRVKKREEIKTTSKTPTSSAMGSGINPTPEKVIQKIVIFYKDGTFEAFEN